MIALPINLLSILGLGGPTAAIPLVSISPSTTTTPPTDPETSRTEKRALEVTTDESPQPSPQRQRTDGLNTRRAPTRHVVQPVPWVPVIARPNGTPLTTTDKINSPDVTYAVAQVALLPSDTEKEKDQSYNVLMKSAFQARARVVPFSFCLAILLYCPVFKLDLVLFEVLILSYIPCRS